MGNSNRVSETFKSYGQTTTIKGIPKVIKSKQYFLRVLWLVAVLFGASFATYQVTTLVIRFLSHSTVTKQENINKQPVFPDFTICNLNPLSKSMGVWNMDVYIYNLWKMLEAENIEPELLANISTIANITTSEYEQIYESIYSIAGFGQNYPLNAEIIEKHSKTFIQDCMFYDWEGTILEIDCESMLIPVLNPYYFICFTMTIPDEYKEDVRGLSVIAYLDITDHALMPTFSANMKNSKSNGVRVKVHARNTLPSLYNGHSLGPGLESTITMSPIRIEKLPEPYGKCTTKEFLEDEDNKEPEEGETPLKYTRASCSSLCKQKIMIRECGCIDPSDECYLKQMLSDNGDNILCGNMLIDNPHTINSDFSTWQKVYPENILRYWNNTLCALRARKLFETECDCKDSCTQEYYELSIAQAEWPMVDYQLAFYEKYIENSPFADEFSYYKDVRDYYYNSYVRVQEVVDLLSNTTKIEDNFVQVNVLFNDPIIQVSREMPAMTWDTVLGTLGGGLNLWIGISFMTLVEWMELTYNLISACCSSPNEETEKGLENKETAEKQNNSILHKKVLVASLAPVDA